MTPKLRRLALASAAALALAAGKASACDDRDEARLPAPRAAYAPAAPVYSPAPTAWRAPVPVEWRGRGELREEYRRLERARERFYWSWDGSPWSQRRFESWYGARRAELDREAWHRRHG